MIVVLGFLTLVNMCGDGAALAFHSGKEYDIRCDAVPEGNLLGPIEVRSNQGSVRGRLIVGIPPDDAIALNLERPFCPGRAWTLATNNQLEQDVLQDVMSRALQREG